MVRVRVGLVLAVGREVEQALVLHLLWLFLLREYLLWPYLVVG